MTKEEYFFFKSLVFPKGAKSVYWKGKRYTRKDIENIKNSIYNKGFD